MSREEKKNSREQKKRLFGGKKKIPKCLNVSSCVLHICGCLWVVRCRPGRAEPSVCVLLYFLYFMFMCMHACVCRIYMLALPRLRRRRRRPWPPQLCHGKQRPLHRVSIVSPWPQRQRKCSLGPDVHGNSSQCFGGRSRKAQTTWSSTLKPGRTTKSHEQHRSTPVQ